MQFMLRGIQRTAHERPQRPVKGCKILQILFFTANNRVNLATTKPSLEITPIYILKQVIDLLAPFVAELFNQSDGIVEATGAISGSSTSPLPGHSQPTSDGSVWVPTVLLN